MCVRACRRCGEFYPADRFKITSRKLSGKVYYKSACALCVAEEGSATRSLRKLHQPPGGASPAIAAGARLSCS